MSNAWASKGVVGRWRAPFVLLLATLAVFFQAVFSSEAFSARDVQRSYYPLKTYWAERVSHGELPQWFPFDGMGQPYISMLVSAALHPLNALYLFFSPENALKWGLLLSYFFAALGAHGLGRRLGLSSSSALVAACTYAFSGYLVSLSNNPHYVAAAAALPWVLWWAHVYLFEGTAGSLFAGAASLALVALAGDPQNFVVASALVAALILLKPKAERFIALRRTAILLAAGAALAAPQIFPALAVRKHIAAQSYSLDAALSWSGHPLRIFEWLGGSLWLDGSGQRMLPGLAKAFDASHEAAWVDSQYLSPLVAVLVFTALGIAGFRTRARGWMFGWFFLLILWLGKHLPVAGLFHALPVWSSFRYPEKLTPWLILGLALVAGLGLERVLTDALARRRAMLASASVGGALLLVAVVEAWAGWPSSSVSTWAALSTFEQAQLHSNLSGNLIISTAVCGLFAALIYLSKAKPSLLPFLGSPLVLHLVLQGAGLYWLVPAEDLRAQPELMRHIVPSEGTRARVLSRVGSAVVPDGFSGMTIPAFMALTTAESFRPLTPSRWDVESLTPYLPAAHRALDKSEEQLEAFAPLWGTKYWVGRTTDPSPENTTELANSPELKLTLRQFTEARPRAYLSLSAGKDLDATGALTTEQARELARTSPVRSRIHPAPATGSAPPDVGASLGTVRWRQYEPEHIELDVNASYDGYLVVNDAAHPGWTATVDGQPATLLTANDVARAVALTKGSHQVAMTFSTPGLRPGLAMAGIALLGLFAFFGFAVRRGRRVDAL